MRFSDRSVDLIQYDCVLFDVDGTLADLHIDWSGVRKDLRVALSRGGSNILPNLGISQMIERAKANGFLEPRHIAAKVLELHESAAPFTPIIAGISLFHSLRGQCNLAIVTNNLHKTAERVLGKLGLFHEALFVVGFDDVNHSKPDPEGVLKALGHFSNQRKALLIGDKESDENAAKMAQIDFLPFKKQDNKP